MTSSDIKQSQTQPQVSPAPTDGTGIVQWDSWLEPYRGTMRARYSRVKDLERLMDEREGGLLKFAEGYRTHGLNRGVSEDGVTQGTHYAEWAPGASNLSLVGEFNNWDRSRNRCTRDQFGTWRCFVPDLPDGSHGIKHGTRVRVDVETHPGQWESRVPAWATRVIQQGSPVFDGQFWCPPESYRWKHPIPTTAPRALRIYETHVGMSSEEGLVSNYPAFTRDVVPYAHAAGYNAIQIMAVMEHAYYGCFGYQVTSFFAASSRFGTPEELKELVDECHARGMHVLLDVVHSHASNNVLDGLNMFDGTDHHYFHSLPRGKHSIWDSRLFNYGNWETLRFLLSNLRWYLEEYRFDGFRFDGVTSMLYVHHGIGDHSFDYDHYFGGAVDSDALAYLTLANDLVHRLRPSAVTIAEDVSGFPGLCRPVPEGGVGFDYRLQMACPDLWVSVLRKLRDEDWDMNSMVGALGNRRYKEPCIAYAESHDQALVGDKTIAFWLMDKEMYWFMSDSTPFTGIIDRGLALHKMIRLITCTLAGEGYLNFMGNEFGHPEWIDFPRPGNNNSYHHARRQWHLVKDQTLRYRFLAAFDKEMMALEERTHFLSAIPAYTYVKHNGDKVVMFERANLLCMFNFHPSQSFTGYRVPVPRHLAQDGSAKFVVALSTDDPEFAGHCRIDRSTVYPCQTGIPCCGSDFSIQVYLPCRSALILRRTDMFC